MNTHFALASHILVALDSRRKFLQNQGKEQTPMPTQALSWSADTHKVFVLRIIKKLEKANIVKTVRGVQGGILLLKPGAEIKLADLYKLTLEDSMSFKIHDTQNKCQIGDNVFEALGSIKLQLEDTILDQLSKVSIEDLADSTHLIAERKISEGKKYITYLEDQTNSR